MMSAFLFDLDGTLVDSVYQHVLAWREAMHEAGIELAVWRIHRQIGMSGGLMLNALFRETGQPVSQEKAERIQRAHADAYERQVGSLRLLPARKSSWISCRRITCRMRSPLVDVCRAPNTR